MNGGLSKAKIAEYTEGFNTFDTEGQGTVSATNLHAILLFLGFEHITRDEAVSMLKSKQLTENGALTLPILLDILTIEHEKEIQASFKMFDKSKNGFITLSDFKAVLKEHEDEHTDEEVEAMFNKADSDNDGNISYQEFAEAYHELH